MKQTIINRLSEHRPAIIGYALVALTSVAFVYLPWIWPDDLGQGLSGAQLTPAWFVQERKYLLEFHPWAGRIFMTGALLSGLAFFFAIGARLIADRPSAKHGIAIIVCTLPMVATFYTVADPIHWSILGYPLPDYGYWITIALAAALAWWDHYKLRGSIDEAAIAN